LKIAEIFYSLQGEGGLVGTPSVFVRTSGCNLRCSWCDTPYTSWEPEGRLMEHHEILQAVEEYPARHVVITGGEPLIAPGIVALSQALAARGMHITMETAGTVFAPVACHLMSISPKLSNSTPPGAEAARHERLRLQPEVLRRLICAYPYQLKFVIASPRDIEEVQKILTILQGDRERVMLMPEGRDCATLRERGPWVAEICKQHGFRYSPRLHVELWGGRRGT